MNVNSVTGNYSPSLQNNKVELSFTSVIPVKFNVNGYGITKPQKVRPLVRNLINILKGKNTNLGIYAYISSAAKKSSMADVFSGAIRHSKYNGVDYIITGKDASILEQKGRNIGSVEKKSEARRAYAHALDKMIWHKTPTLNVEVCEINGKRKTPKFDIISAEFDTPSETRSCDNWWNRN